MAAASSAAAVAGGSPPLPTGAAHRVPLSPKHPSRHSLSSNSKLSPLLSPQTERRISLVSLGAPVVQVPSSPSCVSSRIGVPNIRELRSSGYTSAICGMNGNLVHAVRAAMQGQATVSSDGKVEASSGHSRAVTPTPSTPLSPRTPRTGPAVEKGSLAGVSPALGQLDLQRRQSHSSTSVSSAGGSSTPSTPRQGSIVQLMQSATAPELLINRQQAFHQLLVNLVSYLPPLPASLLTHNTNPSVAHPPSGVATGVEAASSSSGIERMEAQVPPIAVRVECDICAYKEREVNGSVRTAEMDGAKEIPTERARDSTGSQGTVGPQPHQRMRSGAGRKIRSMARVVE